MDGNEPPRRDRREAASRRVGRQEKEDERGTGIEKFPRFVVGLKPKVRSWAKAQSS
jgi:hypothetical protein